MIFKKLIDHLPFILFTYFFVGIIVGGFLSPKERVDLLDSSIITEGWHISAICIALYFPILVFYLMKQKST